MDGWPNTTTFKLLAGGEEAGAIGHYPKGIAFDKNLLLVFPKLTEQRGSGSQGWGRLGATEIKALDLHPLSPWHQETGVTVFDNDAPEQVDDAYEIIAPEPVLTDAQIRAKRNRQLREKGKTQRKRVCLTGSKEID